jgi:hypothetical protein
MKGEKNDIYPERYYGGYMEKQYWRIGVLSIYTELFEKGYPYVHGGAITGCEEKDKERKEYVSNLSKIKIGDILVAGGTINIEYIGEVKAKPVFLFLKCGPARDASFEAADDEIKEVFKKVIKKVSEKDEYEQMDIVCMKTCWYKKIPKGLKMPKRQPPGSCNEITDEEVIKYINDQINQTDRR